MKRRSMKIALLFMVMPYLVTGTPVTKLDPVDKDHLLPSVWQRPGPNASSWHTVAGDRVWSVKLGDICQITRLPLPSSVPYRYLQCVRLYDGENWPWLDKGVWVLKQCPPGHEFHALSSTCRSRRHIRRQQSACNQNPAASQCPQQTQQPYPVQPQVRMTCQCPPRVNLCVCPQPQVFQPQPGYGGGGGGPPCAPVSVNCPQPPQPCPLAPQGVQNAQAGGLCSWMLAPLAADPTTNKCFLQCAPAPANAYCGRWVRMPCAPATIFDVSAQVCVHDPYNTPGPIFPPSAPAPCQTGGTAIGPCNSNMQCPGQSTCQTPQQPPQQCQQKPQQCSVCCNPSGQGSYGGVNPVGAGFGSLV